MQELNNKPYSVSGYFNRLKKYRYLLSQMAKRELKIKYSRTILGISWVIIQPAIAVIIYSLFFNFIFHVETGPVPYEQFVFSGLVVWYLFAGVLSKGAMSLIEMSDVIKKVSFPRIIALMAKIFPACIEGFALLTILITWVIFTYPGVSWQSVFVLFYTLEAMVFSLAM